MKIVHCEQHSLEWLAARAGLATASDFDQLVSPSKLEIRKGAMVESYLARKIAERWIGGAVGVDAMTFDMEQGKIREEEAIPAFEFDFSETITRVGLCLSDDGTIGASPDGLIGDDGGIEIKCPHAETHVKYLLAGELPTDYLLQVQGSMLVTGRKWWKFMSYRRGFPSLVKHVERDDEVCEVLAEALDLFNARLDKGFAKLVEMNGGKAPPKNPFRESVIAQQTEPSIDLMP